MKTLLNIIFCTIIFAAPSQGQILKKVTDRIEKKVENKVNKEIDKTINKTVDRTVEKTIPEAKKGKDTKSTTPQIKNSKDKTNSEILAETQLKSPPENCSENPYLKIGGWEKSPDHVYYNPTADEKTNEKNISTIMGNFFNELQPAIPNPVGSTAIWYKWFVQHENDRIYNPFSAAMNYKLVTGYFAYLCNYENKIVPGKETGTWIYIWANIHPTSDIHYQWFVNDRLGTKYFTLPPQRENWNGFSVYEKETGGRLYYYILLNRAGESPYHTITRREFLDMNRELLKTDPSEKTRARCEKNLAELEKKYEGTLDQPAYIKTYSWTIQNLYTAEPPRKGMNTDPQEIFTTADKGYAFVVGNPNYIKKNIPKWKPQFIWVEIDIPTGVNAAHWLADQMKEFDYGKFEKYLE